MICLTQLIRILICQMHKIGKLVYNYFEFLVNVTYNKFIFLKLKYFIFKFIHNINQFDIVNFESKGVLIWCNEYD